MILILLRTLISLILVASVSLHQDRQQPQYLPLQQQQLQQQLQQQERCLQQQQQHNDFLVIGHAGGDPVGNCENTLSATRSALYGGGANAIEIDLSLSADGIVFLWHDPDPNSFTAMARRLGLGLTGGCTPEMSIQMPASSLPFRQIKLDWGYKDSRGRHLRHAIPTLEEWLREFASDPRLRLIWLDVKVRERELLPRLVSSVVRLLSMHSVGADRVMFSVSDDERASWLRPLLGEYGCKVVSDTVSFRPIIMGDNVSEYSGVRKGALAGGCCANLGAPPVAANRWEAMVRIVGLNLRQRDMLRNHTGYGMKVFVWTIDQENEMRWLIKAGVDGVITNRPHRLAAALRDSGGVK